MCIEISPTTTYRIEVVNERASMPCLATLYLSSIVTGQASLKLHHSCLRPKNGCHVRRCSWRSTAVLMKCRRRQLASYLADAGRKTAHPAILAEALQWLSDLAFLGTSLYVIYDR